MVLFMEAITAFITSHPEADFKPRLILRKVLKSLCAESKRGSDFWEQKGFS